MKLILYLMYGMALIGMSGYANHRGWSFLSVDEVKNVPKSVRNNPGAYRSHYSNYYRYRGGK